MVGFTDRGNSSSTEQLPKFRQFNLKIYRWVATNQGRLAHVAETRGLGVGRQKETANIKDVLKGQCAPTPLCLPSPLLDELQHYMPNEFKIISRNPPIPT